MKHTVRSRLLSIGLAAAFLTSAAPAAGGPAGYIPAPARGESHSVARQWNEQNLDAIRRDVARPTVHARNLFHVSAAMWDAWAAFDPYSDPVLHDESAAAEDLAAARAEAISFAAYRVLSYRFADSPGADTTLPALDQLMDDLGYDRDFTGTSGESPAALGNRIAQTVITFGQNDGANEEGGYANQFYEPVNDPLFPDLPGNQDMEFPNHWQQLALDVFCDQIGNICFPIGEIPPFLSPEWGEVVPFAMTAADLTLYPGPDEHFYWVYHDPGPPPMLNGDGDQEFRDGFVQVIEFSSYLDPDDGVVMDISPASMGNNSLGTNDGQGHDLNPVTGQPYTEQIVPRGDYTRVLAEFWADGPDSETPPGHWFTILNYVSDHPQFEKRFEGEGPVLDNLEWDVKAYLALAGTLHDVAVAVWGAKGYYDYVRPISAIRYMADRGQSSNPELPSFHPDGLPLIPGLIELITEQSSAAGKRHEHLAEHVGEIALYAWYGFPFEGKKDAARDGHLGVRWIRAREWWPYQRPTFVTPPFAGYTSGHSTFSRAAAETMTRLTGTRFFPGGMGEFFAPAGEFLEFELGPSVDLTLQWATYQDASDETSLSRIYGGIHPTQDDIPGRLAGYEIGHQAFDHAARLILGEAIFLDQFE